ncbi:MAG TPA: hypothetical protein VNO30_44700 [Kofleriaceae bacterium]|nr:hypothetical protein [Kofleriaceae bacterium]
MRRAGARAVLAAAIALAGVPRPAVADPLRLRADALASTASPAGLLVLDAGGALRPGLSAEAVVWLASERAPGEDTAGDVLVIAVRGQTRSGRIGVRAGRFVSALGALRPAHVDGGALRLRLPRGLDVEAVAGVPVEPGLATGRGWDWLAGARLARRIGDGGSAGIAYVQRRDAGRLALEELGADAGLALTARHDLGARAAYDLAHPGLAEVALTASYRRRAARAELYALHRAASHLLPATSLFSVLGDVPSERAGAVITWRAAPRLDAIADLGGRRIDAARGLELALRARLRLDDRGASALSGELRRSGVAQDGTAWSGARATARIALPRALAIAAELELVAPDRDRGRGALWPWGLLAVSWERAGWQAAAAVEASASPEYRSRVDVLAQLGRRWSAP